MQKKQDHLVEPQAEKKRQAGGNEDMSDMRPVASPTIERHPDRRNRHDKPIQNTGMTRQRIYPLGYGNVESIHPVRFPARRSR